MLRAYFEQKLAAAVLLLARLAGFFVLNFERKYKCLLLKGAGLAPQLPARWN